MSGVRVLRGALKGNNRLNVTLSLDTGLFNELKRESDMSSASVNSRINIILARHVHFYKIMDEIGRNMIPHNVFASMLEIMDEDKLCSIMENQSIPIIYSIFTHSGITLSLDNIEEHFFQQAGLWSGMYSAFHSHIEPDKTINLTFEHKYGTKWSRALGRMFSSIIKNLLGIQAHYEIMGNTVKVMILGAEKLPFTKTSILEKISV